MEKEYLIEIRCLGKEIEEMENGSTFKFSLNKEIFNEMVLLCDYISNQLFEAEFCVGSMGLNSNDITLKVYSEEDILFKSVKAFLEYKDNHHIEARLTSDFSLITYVNNIRYYGEIEDGMIIKTSSNGRELQ
ncbi:hypothetical protein WMO40_20550 [Bacillaceae bacterium CLA-AA-H227]|uniref:Uncharacterized protein n=1 Tax=Robertmurraya yapensis (ex Hitch et al 2024) TaxID=3133160 RepID=A0ACC6SGB2_9BACI